MASTKKTSAATVSKKSVTPAKASTAEKPKAANSSARPKSAAEKPGAKAAGKAATPAKPVAAKSAKASATPRKTARKAAAPGISPEQRRHYVEVAAFYIAERRGFVGGNAAEDWAQAEREVERLLAEGLINVGA